MDNDHISRTELERALRQFKADIIEAVMERVNGKFGNVIRGGLVRLDRTSGSFSGVVNGQAFKPSGLTGATAASRYVGATASGAPATGTFALGDFVIDQSGTIYVCTVAGSPGTWVNVSSGGGGGTASLTVKESDGTPSVSDVTTIVVNNGALTDSGGGTVSIDVAGTVSAFFHGARVFHNANQSIANATNTALAFNSERFDTDGFHDTVTNNSRLTIPTGQGGKYFVWANIRWDNSTATSFRIAVLRLNGTTEIARQELPGATNASLTFVLSSPYELTAGDYVEVVVRQDSGSSMNIVSVPNSTPEFGLFKVG